MTLRGPTIVHSVATLLLCWQFMQAAHETGHVLGAWLTGGTVVKVVLHPLTISRTDVSPNPAPLIELWAGPLGGVLIPLLMWSAAGHLKKSLSAWLRFFTGFCLIANGCYLGTGLFDPVGDASDLIRHGAPIWQLGVFGAITMPAGFYLWHGLGAEFGWGPHGRLISWQTAGMTSAALIVVVVLELFLSPH